MICVPGIPIKRNNPCIDPLQNQISHVIKSYKTDKDGNIVSNGYVPNTLDYPEYSFSIQLFIDKNFKEMK